MGSFAFFISCNDKDSGGDLSTEWKDYKYSELSTTQQKEKLQNDANALLADLEGLKNNDAIKVLKTFNQLLEISAPEYGSSTLRSAEDVILLSNFYGKFTWNASKKVWNFAEATDKLEFEFPVESKTGRIVIPKISSSVVVNGEDEQIEIPKDVTAKIYSNTSEVGSIHATSAIVDAKTAPVLTELSYVLGEYTSTSSLSKASPNKFVSTFKKGDKTLIEANMDLTGNVDNLIEDKDPGNMVGNTFINVTNTLAFAGNVDITQYQSAEKEADAIREDAYDKASTALWDAYSQADEQYKKDAETYGWEVANDNYNKTIEAEYAKYIKAVEASDKVYIEAEVSAFNKYFDLYLISLSDKTKIAKLAEKAKSHTEYGYTYWELVPVLRFGDGTEVEAEVYFSAGFDLFLENLEKFVASFE
jgi:hypothetical protein